MVQRPLQWWKTTEKKQKALESSEESARPASSQKPTEEGKSAPDQKKRKSRVNGRALAQVFRSASDHFNITCAQLSKLMDAIPGADWRVNVFCSGISRCYD
jgi:hypothetical protein